MPSSGVWRRVDAASCSRWFFARGFFYPEDGGDTILRNVGSIDYIYTAPHPEDGILQIYFDPNILCTLLTMFSNYTATVINV
jgi:hypothetical protein